MNAHPPAPSRRNHAAAARGGPYLCEGTLRADTGVGPSASTHLEFPSPLPEAGPGVTNRKSGVREGGRWAKARVLGTQKARWGGGAAGMGPIGQPIAPAFSLSSRFPPKHTPAWA